MTGDAMKPHDFLRRCRSLTAAVLVLLASGIMEAQFKIDEASLAEVMAEVLPRVEKATGSSLRETISCRLTGIKGLKRILRKDLEPQFRAICMDEATVSSQLKNYSALLASMMFAKFDFSNKAILVCPTNLEKVARVLKEPKLLERSCLRAILVHECVHASDDLKYGFSSKVITLKSREAILAFNAVIEGHAQHLTRKICADAGWNEGFEVFTRCIGKIPEDESISESDRFMTRLLMTDLTMAYYQGERFIAELDRKGGEEAVARAFASPPGEPVLIDHPGWFLDPATRPEIRYDLDGVLDIFVKAFDEKAWNHRKTTATRAHLEAAMAPLPEAKNNAILDSLKTYRVAVLNPPKAPQSKLVMAAIGVMASVSDAKKFYACQKRLLRVKDEKMTRGSVRVLDAKYEATEGKGWKGVYYTKKARAFGQIIVVRGFLACQADVNVEFIFSGHEVEKKWVLDLAARILAALRTG